MAEVNQPFRRSVGPVLTSGLCADAIVAAIQAENAGVRIQNQAGYLRVLVPERCRVTAAAIERALGRPFLLPRDLESVMPSFKGRMHVDQLSAVWEAGAR